MRATDEVSEAEGLSGKLWPVHLKPLEDELLSSWLVRLARAHGLRLHTFCDLAWRRKAIWNRDIDKSADEEILRVLSEKTATPIERVRQTTLAAYEGWLYEKHNPYGNTNWILPLGVYHRLRRRRGLQYCPRCLRSDGEPYFRRRWRLAFMTVCETHGVLLLDKCQRCGAPVNFHRVEPRQESIECCFRCGFNLNKARTSKLVRCQDLCCLSAERRWLDAIRQGYIRVSSEEAVDSLLFFRGLRILVRALYSPRHRERVFVRKAAERFDLPRLTTSLRSRHADFEHHNLLQRHLGTSYLASLLDQWPTIFLQLSKEARLSRAYIVGDRLDVPFWLEHAALDSLRAGTREIGDAEYSAMRCYLETKLVVSAPWYRNLVRQVGDMVRRRGTPFRAPKARRISVPGRYPKHPTRSGSSAIV